jgi:flavodoxin/ferredoxin
MSNGLRTLRKEETNVKTLVISFSQTGNTQKVAENIRDGIVDATDQCDLTTLDKVDVSALAGYDLVGLGCPVFYFQEPFNVRSFMEGLPALDGKQWFIFCTHGSVMGNALVLMWAALKKKGIMLIGHHHTYADGTLPFYPYPTLTTGHPDALDLEEARTFGKAVADRSRRIAAGDSIPISEPLPVNEEWIDVYIQMFTPENMKQMLPQLRIDMDRCTQCQECADNCPVAGIDMASDPPRIQDPCVYCWYCAKICPTQAIQADWDMLVAMAPDNYALYRKALDEAAARGEYRWLIDPDSIDFDDPLYKQREREIEGK